MWLLKTPPRTGIPSTLELHQRQSSQEPYAILSHTWGPLKDEILFEDLIRYCDRTIRQNEGYISVDYRLEPGVSLRNKPGWLKVEASIKQARADGYGWVWADTCCIDKSSSAELSEAINSMYAWYETSAVCYAFLADVSSKDPDEVRRNNFYASRWFTRGWTLQELIAPSSVVFYSREWSPLGNKRSLASALTVITKIDQGTLKGTRPLESASVAQRMSWAASRQTSRVEDRAYSLIGLFGVNMPMLYGEGARAFQRLQHEIIKLSDDQSIFAWTDSRIASDTRHGLLADDPSAFAHTMEYRTYSAFDDMKPFDMSNRGLSINLPLTPTEDSDIYVGTLHCPIPPTTEGYLAIYLQKLPTGDNQYARIRCGQLASMVCKGTKQDVYVKPSFPRQEELEGIVLPWHYVVTRNLYSTDTQVEWSLISAFGAPPQIEHLERHEELRPKPKGRMKGNTSFKVIKEKGRLSAALILERPSGGSLAVMIGALSDIEPGFDVQEYDKSEHDWASEFRMTDLEAKSKPVCFGSTLVVGHHSVTVRVDIQIKDDIRMYFVDIYIKGEPSTHVEEMVEDLGGVKRDFSMMTRIKRMFKSDSRG